MTKKIFSILLLAVLFAACSSYKTTSNIKKIEFGMTKKEIISVMGDKFRMEAGIPHPEGNIEVISYEYVDDAGTITGRYYLHLKEGKLVEWYRDVDRPNDYDHHHRPHSPGNGRH